MKAINIITTLALAVVGFWWLVGTLSADALYMGIGIVFGALASIPAALLVLAASRRPERAEPRPRPQPPSTKPQPPVVMVQGVPVDDVSRTVERRKLSTGYQRMLTVDDK